MTIVSFPTAPINSCCACDLPGDSSSLLQCAKCQVARYCSYACQKTDWPVHRYFCVDVKDILDVYDDPKEAEDAGCFLKWLAHWRTAILCWAAFSADLGHQSDDYLLKHSFILVLDKKTAPPGMEYSPRASYTPHRAGMSSDVELLAYIHGISDPVQREYILKEFTTNKPEIHHVRAMIVAETCCTSESDTLVSIFPDHSYNIFADSMSAQARSHSTYLKLAFLDKFYEYLNKGKGK
ncbi:hypothetical protein B0H13DRAFT_1856533 [Mycena leptocephala]|nr:hypothetical protein B0H13DRAFT_1856533 [Mycena leptocephala]